MKLVLWQAEAGRHGRIQHDSTPGPLRRRQPVAEPALLLFAALRLRRAVPSRSARGLRRGNARWSRAADSHFRYEDILRAKAKNPHLVCIQRINDNDVRKATNGMDRLLAEANRAADHTVFVSEWLREYHASRWFEPAKPHSVILEWSRPGDLSSDRRRGMDAGARLCVSSRIIGRTI